METEVLSCRLHGRDTVVEGMSPRDKGVTLHLPAFCRDSCHLPTSSPDLEASGQVYQGVRDRSKKRGLPPGPQLSILF